MNAPAAMLRSSDTTTESMPVARCSWEGDSRDSLRDRLRAGAGAVILADPRGAELWQAFSPLLDSTVALLAAARNHSRRETRFGDTLRFVPGMTAHFARKLIVRTDDGGRTLGSLPAQVFHQGHLGAVPQAAMRTAWDLMSEILTDVTGTRPTSQRYALGIELLTYPRSTYELDRVFDLLADSAGRWTRFGRKLDMHKGALGGQLDRRMVRDVAAWASVVGAGGLIRWIDRLGSSPARIAAPRNGRLLLKPHADAGKALTALIGDRRSVRTQVFCGGEWVDLPIGTTSIAIFPSAQLDESFGIRPTTHRVIMVDEEDEPGSLHCEQTLSLTIVADPNDETRRATRPDY